MPPVHKTRWGSPRYVPWEQLESKIPHNNQPSFCYCDNFVSFWELKWNFDDGYDWDGVPFISHKKPAGHTALYIKETAIAGAICNDYEEDEAEEES